MKRFAKVTMASVLTLSAMFSTVACGGETSGNSSQQDDPTKTTIRVWNYNGGYGTDWLDDAAAAFEKAVADKEYESGKKGVKIKVDGVKPSTVHLTASAIRTGAYHMYFTEGQDYYTTVIADDGNGTPIADISEALTTPNEFDGNKTVLSKLTAQQQSYYGIADANDGGKVKYYGLPHYLGNYGFMYDMDWFAKNNLYFRDGYEEALTDSEKFISPRTTLEKSAGQDGVKGTFDDGLPVTFDDFYVLLDAISNVGRSISAITWTGKYAEQYIDYPFNALAADVDGAEQHMLKYTMDGVATSLGTVSADYKWVPDANSTTITTANAYEMARQEGTWRALEFFSTIFGNTNYYRKPSGSDEQTAAQDRLVENEAGILMEGVWWEGEAAKNGKYSDGSKRSERNFGMMPMPKAPGHEGDRNTIVDVMNSLCMVKADITAAEKAVAIDFIKFVYSDEQLVKFTQNTNALKAVNYTISDSDLNKLSSFGRNIYEYVKSDRTDVVYEYSNVSAYYNNATALNGRQYYQAKVGDNTKAQNPKDYLLDSQKTSKEDIKKYFEALAAYHQAQWPSILLLG